ncbi:MAG: dihydroorotase [Leptonema sp. (in: bacteria)]
MQEIEITQPNDFHIHLRQDDFLKDTLNHAKKFKKILVMPNLKPPIVKIKQAEEYRKQILFYIKKDSLELEPYFTLYLNQDTDKKELKKFRNYPWLLGIKLYPSGVTTNSEYGIDKIEHFYSYFELMEKYRIPLMVHAEANDETIDFFDREKVFIETHLTKIRNKFPELKITLEHVSTKIGVDFVKEFNNIGGTVTPHHLLLTRNDLFIPCLQPHLYCLPILKRKEDQGAIAKEVLLGNPKFFAGTDSAPHPREKKEANCCAAGIFSSTIAIELYVTFFELHHSLDKTLIENFLSINGCKFYDLPIHSNTIKILRSSFTIPESYPLGKKAVIPMWAGKTLHWKASF